MGHACSSHKDRPSQGEYPPPGSTLEQALQNTGAARGPEEMQLLKDARDRLFREMDLDGNGTIDRAEMESFLERSEMLGSSAALRETMRALFNNFDQNGDGQIDFGEFGAALDCELNTLTEECENRLLFNQFRPDSGDRLSNTAAKVPTRPAKQEAYNPLYSESTSPSSPGGALVGTNSFDYITAKDLVRTMARYTIEGEHQMTLQQAESLIAEFKPANPGKITYEEFCKMKQCLVML